MQSALNRKDNFENIRENTMCRLDLYQILKALTEIESAAAGSIPFICSTKKKLQIFY